jgi:putative Mg2+ transporter-C (MgtC) family protein
LASAVAMCEANLLLATDGKTGSSFGTMDVMRLPLGVLTGVGFIGGGSIIQRGDLATGVTTAATLWVMTAIGLCFGGGQLGLGIAATTLTVLTLAVLKWAENCLPREQRATLVVAGGGEHLSAADVTKALAAIGFRARLLRQGRSSPDADWQLCFEVRWKQPERSGPPFDKIEAVRRRFGLERFEMPAAVAE